MTINVTAEKNHTAPTLYTALGPSNRFQEDRKICSVETTPTVAISKLEFFNDFKAFSGVLADLISNLSLTETLPTFPSLHDCRLKNRTLDGLNSAELIIKTSLLKISIAHITSKGIKHRITCLYSS